MTNTRITVMASLLALTGCCAVEGSGVYAEQRRDLPAFDGISISSGLHAEIAPGPTDRVVVRGDDNLLSHIVTRVVGSRLEVSCDTWVIDALDSTGVAFTIPALRTIDASDGSSVRSIDMIADKLSVDASSGSSVCLSGQATRLELDVSSGSSVDARNLTADVVTVDVSSGSDVRVNAAVEVSGEASSGSSVHIQGAAATVKVDSSSGSNVTRE